MSGHHCPRILRSGSLRHGAWASCRCGWTSEPMTTTTGASVAWALHIRDDLDAGLLFPPEPNYCQELTA